jgi:hypothetical protein
MPEPSASGTSQAGPKVAPGGADQVQKEKTPLIPITAGVVGTSVLLLLIKFILFKSKK